MSSAVGDLVATLGIDDSNWQRGIQRSEQSAKKFSGQVGTHMGETSEHVNNADRALKYIGRSLGEAGEQAGRFSEELGMGLSAMGTSVTVVGEASEGVEKLGKAYKWAAAQGALMNALSGPMGWIALAGAAAAAGGAYYYFSGSSSEVTGKHEEEAKAIDELINKIKDLEASRYSREGTTMGGMAQQEFLGQNHSLQDAEKKLRITRQQIYENAELLKQLEAKSKGSANLPEKEFLEEFVKINEARARMKALAGQERNDFANVEKYKEEKRQSEIMELGQKQRDKEREALQKHQQEYKKYADTLEEQGARLYQTPAEQEKWNIRHSGADYTKEELTSLDAIIDKNAQLSRTYEDQNAVFAEGVKLMEEMQTPAEKYAQQIDHLGDLVLEGAIDWETYTRAGNDAMQKWIDADPLDKKEKPKTAKEAELPKALEIKTDEAWKAIVNAMNPRNDATDRLADNSDIMVARLDKIADREPEEVGIA